MSMFKTGANEVWAFDAEWVPDPAAGRVLYGLPDACTDREVVKEMWQRHGAAADDPMPYLKTVLCRVVSIAAVIRRVMPDGAVKLLLHSLPGNVESEADRNEAVILSRFLSGVGQRKPQLIGFNSQAADFKIFIQRSIVKGISVPAFCARPGKPWEGRDYFVRGSEWHIDLKDIVSGWGKATPSLHELATLSGIPGKMDVDGKHIAEMWLDGDLKGIVQYNECDALTTYLVWLRIAHFGGFFTEDAYCEEQDRVRALIADKSQYPRYTHLIVYEQEWNRLQTTHTFLVARELTEPSGALVDRSAAPSYNPPCGVDK
jgi:predicted PolB exonuclease-like 3'-5' exonuclease